MLAHALGMSQVPRKCTKCIPYAVWHPSVALRVLSASTGMNPTCSGLSPLEHPRQHRDALVAVQVFCQKVITLQELEPVVAEKTGKSGLKACAQAVKDHLHEASYSHEEVSTQGLMSQELSCT